MLLNVYIYIYIVIMISNIKNQKWRVEIFKIIIIGIWLPLEIQTAVMKENAMLANTAQWNFTARGFPH